MQEAARVGAMWEAKIAKLEDKLAEARSHAEAQRGAMQQRLADADSQRVALEGTWQRRVMEAEQGQSNLKAEVHAKLLVVSERLEGLVAREAKHAARRGESRFLLEPVLWLLCTPLQGCAALVAAVGRCDVVYLKIAPACCSANASI